MKKVLAILLFVAALSLIIIYRIEFKEPDSLYVCDKCNVILISVDTLRADSLPCYGYHRDTAPILCEFADNNLLFENNFSNAASTLPSHYSILTGLYPSSHGVIEAFTKKVNPNITTLPKLLKDAGYETIYAGSKTDEHLPFSNQEDGDFDILIHNNNNWDEIVNQISVNNQTSKPTFLFLHTYEAHSPYFKYSEEPIYTDKIIESIPLTEDDWKKFDEELLKTAITTLEGRLEYSDSKESKEYLNEIIEQLKSAKSVDEAERVFNSLPERERGSVYDERYLQAIFNDESEGKDEYLRALYDEGINNFDKETFSDFMEALESSGFLDNTIVIVTSDHGESFGEHNQYTHGGKLYSTTTHVPLIMRIPGIEKKRVKELTQGIDIYPTVAGLLGLESPEYVQGIDLREIITEQEFPKKNKYLLAESYGLHYKTIQNGVWKLQLYNHQTKPLPKRYEIYNLKYDPKETTNLDKYLPWFKYYLEWKMNAILSDKPEFEAVDVGFPDWIDEKKREELKESGYF